MVHRDDYGTLWERRSGNELLKFVEVINSTPEPDGRFRNYWLRVDPAMKRAKEAVAWSFNKTEDEYEPAQET